MHFAVLQLKTDSLGIRFGNSILVSCLNRLSFSCSPFSRLWVGAGSRCITVLVCTFNGSYVFFTCVFLNQR